MKILVTGAYGFVGQHLLAHLVQKGRYEVVALSLHKHELSPLSVPQAICDVRDAAAVERTVKQLKPDAIIHLAAMAHVPTCTENPALAFDVNVQGLWHVLVAVKSLEKPCRVVAISSSEVYGRIDDLCDAPPLREGHPCRPMNVYALSKWTAEQVAFQAKRLWQLDVVVLRPFNHFGPLQQKGYVISDFCAQIAAAEAGLQEPVMTVGRCDVARDFSDVRDIVRAYEMALIAPLSGEAYNICSGHAVSVQSMLDQLLRLSRIPLRVETKVPVHRKHDVPVLWGSYEAFQKVTGWGPTYVLWDSLAETLDYWRTCMKDKDRVL